MSKSRQIGFYDSCHAFSCFRGKPWQIVANRSNAVVLRFRSRFPRIAPLFPVIYRLFLNDTAKPHLSQYAHQYSTQTAPFKHSYQSQQAFGREPYRGIIL